MSFDNFLETLDNVPPEVERNFTLIEQLDRRSNDILLKLKKLLRDYENSEKQSSRLTIRAKSKALFEKLHSLSEDKVVLAQSTYELIDKNISKLIGLGATQIVDNGESETPLGYDMPLDPNEPKYCICHGVSHGEMIACDNKECPIEWFHYGCVGLVTAPKAKWYCGPCLAEVKAQYRNMKKKRRKR